MGIIDGQAQQPMQAQPPAQPPVQEAPAQAQPPVQAPAQGDPRGPEKYTRVVLAATKILYDPKMTQKILKIVKDAQTPEIGLARATGLVMMALDQQAKGSIPKEVKVPAAKEIMGLIAELAEKSGIIPSAAEAVAKTGKLIAYTLMKTAGAKDEQLKIALSSPGRSGAFKPAMRGKPAVEAAPVEGV